MKPSKIHIRVVHAELERADEDSAYRSVCPVCKTGLLLIHRDKETFKLVRSDICIQCGQGFYYTDDKINGEEFTEKVPYPLFEIVGPPCPAPGCKGVLTSTMSLKTKEWFGHCHVCNGEYTRAPAGSKREWIPRGISVIEGGKVN
jgi:hypothetical protein